MDSLLQSQLLKHPSFPLPFRLTCDASKYGLLRILSQINLDTKEDDPIIFARRSLSVAQCNYNTTECEALCILRALRKFRPYILGMSVTVITDHSALKYILNLKHSHEKLGNKLTRWALEFQEYYFTMEVLPGTKIPYADALSREPFAPTETWEERRQEEHGFDSDNNLVQKSQLKARKTQPDITIEFCGDLTTLIAILLRDEYNWKSLCTPSGCGW